MWAIFAQDNDNFLLGVVNDDGSWDALDQSFPDIPEQIEYEPATGLPFPTKIGDEAYPAAVINYLIDNGYDPIPFQEDEKGNAVMLELPGLFVLDDSEEEDWPKRTSWDLPPYDPEQWPFNQDWFKKSVPYKSAVQGGLIVDDKWLGPPEGYCPIPPA